MEKVKIEIPKIEHKKPVMNFRKDFLRAEEKISGGVGLEKAENYEDWLYHKFVPHYGQVDEVVFLAFDSQKELVGISDIRLGTNEFIPKFAGQIGYSVRPSQSSISSTRSTLFVKSLSVTPATQPYGHGAGSTREKYPLTTSQMKSTIHSARQMNISKHRSSTGNI